MVMWSENMKIKNKFVNRVLVLLTGNTVAQLIIFASSPILTRIYRPEDFGVFSVYTSLLTILLSFSSLCLEKAIPLEENNKNTFHLIMISLFMITVCCTINIIFSFFHLSLFQLYGIESTLVNASLLSCGLFFAGIYQVMNYWLVKEEKFKGITHSKLVQSISNVGSQFSLAPINHYTPGIGLVVGDVIGRAVSLAFIWKFYLKQIDFPKFSMRRARFLFYKYKRFAQYSTWSTLLSALSMQMIFLLLMRLYGSEATGYFSMAFKTIGLPITLVGASISQVFYSEVAQRISDEPAKVMKLYKRIIMRIAMFGIPSIAILSFTAPDLFRFVFGEEWLVSGEYVRLMSFMFLAQVNIIPVSQILYLIGKQRTQLLWDLLRLVLTSSSILLIFMLGGTANKAILTFSICMGTSYYVLALLGYWAIKSIERRRD